jgi:hypothetical protein
MRDDADWIDFDHMMVRAGIEVAAEHRNGALHIFNGLRDSVRLINQVRPCTSMPAYTFSIEAVVRGRK